MLKKMWTEVMGGEVKVARTDKVGFPSVLFRKDYCCKFGGRRSGGVRRGLERTPISKRRCRRDLIYFCVKWPS